jgi:hypothetical protein
MSIPFQANKTYGIKGMIWKTASGVHQETWYDDGSGWKKAGVYDRPSCGQKQTSTARAPNAQVEFRIDCNNVTFSGTDVAVINPSPTVGYYYDAGAGYYDSGPGYYDAAGPDDYIVEDEHLP